MIQSWEQLFEQERNKPYFAKLSQFIEQERSVRVIYPPEDQWFAAFDKSPFEHTRVVIIGQDPYHGAGQAHGLCFSVKNGVEIPPSLRNIFKEMKEDLRLRETPDTGDLSGWAEQGVLLLNSVLTVRDGEANSHQGRGWETFTDAVVEALNLRQKPVAFLLWGNHARRKGGSIDRKRHLVLESAHPSPLSAHRGFEGSRPFSQVNAWLKAQSMPPIEWHRLGHLQHQEEHESNG